MGFKRDPSRIEESVNMRLDRAVAATYLIAWIVCPSGGRLVYRGRVERYMEQEMTSPPLGLVVLFFRDGKSSGKFIMCTISAQCDTK